MNSPIRVGIVGVNAARGWAADAHIPALRALPAFEITALSTTRQESADAAGRAFGVGLTFDDHEALVRRPEVDLVVVTVKVPHHREIVTAALNAGKSVYSEWPLGRDHEEAREMTELAASRKAATLVGLQSRRSPAVRHIRDLIADGYLGTILSTTMVGSSRLGGEIDAGNAYNLDQTNAASMLNVAAGHSLDAMAHVLGDFAELSALLGTRRPSITVEGTGERLVKTSPDQIAIHGRLETGVTASVHFREGNHGGTGLLWEINGTEGTLQLRAASAHPGMYHVTVSGSRGRQEIAEIPVPGALTAQTPGLDDLDTMVANVARMYDAFASDVKRGSHDAPGFAEALSTHRLIETIQRAAMSGARITHEKRESHV